MSWCRETPNGPHRCKSRASSKGLRSPCDHVAEGLAREAPCLSG